MTGRELGKYESEGAAFAFHRRKRLSRSCISHRIILSAKLSVQNIVSRTWTLAFNLRQVSCEGVHFSGRQASQACKVVCAHADGCAGSAVCKEVGLREAGQAVWGREAVALRLAANNPDDR